MSAKRGRKKLDGVTSDMVAVNLYSADYDLINNICDKYGLTRSALVRQLINDYLNTQDVEPLIIKVHRQKWAGKSEVKKGN